MIPNRAHPEKVNAAKKRKNKDRESDDRIGRTENTDPLLRMRRVRLQKRLSGRSSGIYSHKWGVILIVCVGIVSRSDVALAARSVIDPGKNPLCAPEETVVCSRLQTERYLRYRSTFNAGMRAVDSDLERALKYFRTARSQAEGDTCAAAQLDDLIIAASKTKKQVQGLTVRHFQDRFDVIFQHLWLHDKCDRN